LFEAILLLFNLNILGADKMERLIRRGTFVEGTRKILYGYIDNETKKWIIEPKYEDASLFQNGIAIVKINGTRYKINEKEEIVSELTRFDNIGLFFDGLAWAVPKNNSNFRRPSIGYINEKEQWVIQPFSFIKVNGNWDFPKNKTHITYIGTDGDKVILLRNGTRIPLDRLGRPYSIEDAKKLPWYKGDV
jgi:uncharacterized protein YlzI (FlbEa/FlbD family)